MHHAVKEEERKHVCVDAFWREHYWSAQTHKAKGSLVAEASLYAHWIQPILGKLPIIALAPMDLERMKSAMLEAGKAPASIKYAFAVVSQLWTTPSGMGWSWATAPPRPWPCPSVITGGSVF